MIDVTIQVTGDTIKTEAENGENLLHVIRRAGVHIDAPCNGNGTCGKCRVKLVQGRVKQDNLHHKQHGSAKGMILACSTAVEEPLVIEVPKESVLNVSNIRVDVDQTHHDSKYYRAQKIFADIYGRESHVRKLDIELVEPTLDDNLSDVARIRKLLKGQLGCKETEISIHVLRKIPLILRDNHFRVSIVYTNSAEDKIRVIDIKPFGAHIGYGIAVDIGTTSVAACLVDLQNNKVMGEAVCANAQSKYGADVINRIIFSAIGNGLQTLKDAVVHESINPLIMELCNVQGISCAEVVLFSASANTTMTQFLLGIYSDYLRKEPYIPALTDTDHLDIRADDIGLCIHKNAQIILAPAVASYVGGDISAGVLPAFIRESEKISILIDLGTNGEIVLGNSDFLMTCACSAGPAFEGGEMTCGMRAGTGAIEAVAIHNDYEAYLKIIGSDKPAGICGSGIIDLISELKRVGLIDAKGRFKKEISAKRVVFDEYGIGHYIVASREQYGIEDDIVITEVDIDNFIRAKAAVYSATCVLIASLGFKLDDVAEIKVAGGIGNHINITKAIYIGLFPDIDLKKYVFIGNSSLTGSYLSLINKKATKYIEETANQMTYLELSVYPGYMDEFISASFIPHTDLLRFPSQRAL